MNEKPKAIIRSGVAMLLIAGTMYCFFSLQDRLLTAVGFFALGVHGWVTRIQFTPMFLAGLLFLSLSIEAKVLRFAVLLCFLCVFGFQFWLMLKFKETANQIKLNGGALRSALWDYDLSVWMLRKVFKKTDAA